MYGWHNGTQVRESDYRVSRSDYAVPHQYYALADNTTLHCPLDTAARHGYTQTIAVALHCYIVN